MSKRKMVPAIDEEKLSDRDVRRIIENCEEVRLASAILLRGYPFATTRFPHYSGFLTKLRVAYDHSDSQSFLFYLQVYFDHARRYIPQVPVREKTEKIWRKVADLINQYGVRAVAGCILARMFG